MQSSKAQGVVGAVQQLNQEPDVKGIILQCKGNISKNDYGIIASLINGEFRPEFRGPIDFAVQLAMFNCRRPGALKKKFIKEITGMDYIEEFYKLDLIDLGIERFKEILQMEAAAGNIPLATEQQYTQQPGQKYAKGFSQYTP